MKKLFIPGYLILGLQVQAAELSAGATKPPEKLSSVYSVTERGAKLEVVGTS